MAPPAAYQQPYGYGRPYADPQFDYAGFWRRVPGHIVDDLIACAILFAIALVANAATGGSLFQGSGSSEQASDASNAALGITILVGGVLIWLYYALMQSSRRQATLGQMMMGLRVVDKAGSRISFLRATGRWLASLLNLIIPFRIGYMLAGWTPQKQAIHDLIAGTLVIRKDSAVGQRYAQPYPTSWNVS